MTDTGPSEHEREVLALLPLVYLPLRETRHVVWLLKDGAMVRYVDGKRVDP